MMAATLTPAATDAIGQTIAVETEIIDGQTLIVLSRAGETMADLEPDQALALAHALRAAG